MISIVSATGSRPLSGERAFDLADELVGVELASGDVDGDADRIPRGPPDGALTAGLLEHPAADLDDQPGLLEQGDEVVGLDDAAHGVLPADQRLDPVGGHVAEVEGGLVDEEELAFGERLAQVHLELHAVLHGVLHPALEHDEAVLAVPLGAVHRDVRVAQELLRGVAVSRRDPDARGHGDAVLLVLPELEGVLERVEQALGDQFGAGVQRELLGDHHELVPAEAPERVGPADHAVQARGDRLQELVADGVAEGVVDALEVVEVDEQRRRTGSGCAASARASARRGRGSGCGWGGR